MVETPPEVPGLLQGCVPAPSVMEGCGPSSGQTTRPLLAPLFGSRTCRLASFLEKKPCVAVQLFLGRWQCPDGRGLGDKHLTSSSGHPWVALASPMRAGGAALSWDSRREAVEASVWLLSRHLTSPFHPGGTSPALGDQWDEAPCPWLCLFPSQSELNSETRSPAERPWWASELPCAALLSDGDVPVLVVGRVPEAAGSPTHLSQGPAVPARVWRGTCRPRTGTASPVKPR